MKRRLLHKLANPNSFDIDNLSYLTNILPPNGSTRKSAIFFKPNGAMCYGVADTSELYQYELTTPWDISTIVPNYLTTSETGNNQGIYISPDGLNLYYNQITPSNRVRHFLLTTPWDVSVKTLVSSFAIPSNNRGVEFRPNGLKMYVLTSTNIYEYTLSVAWDLTTAVLSHTLDLSAIGTIFEDLRISIDGNNIFLVRNENITQYKMSSAWDLSTATFFKNRPDNSFLGLFIKQDGSAFYATANVLNRWITQFNWT